MKLPRLTAADRHRIAAGIIASRPVSTRPDGLLPADLEVLVLVDAGHISVSSPADSYRLVGPDPINRLTADRLSQLRERKLVALAHWLRGESYPSDGWPQPYALTDAGREALA